MNEIKGIIYCLGDFSVFVFVTSNHASDGIIQARYPVFGITTGRIFFGVIDTAFIARTTGGAPGTNIGFSRGLDMEDVQFSFLIEGMHRSNEISRLDCDGNRAPLISSLSYIHENH